MLYESYIVGAGQAVEVAGVAALIGGAGLAGTLFVRRLLAGRGFEGAYQGLRADLGRAILLGLELLVIGDIIGTVVIEPDLRNLAVLGAIVGIRTLLSIVLELEVSGHWPWQRKAAAPGGRQR